MKQRGRKSATSQESGNVVDLALATRPHAPDELTEAEKKRFNDITASRPADYFDVATVQLLAEYVSIPTELAIVGEAIRGFQAEWLSTDAGMARFAKLSGMRDKAQKRMATLATKLRLAQQSRYEPKHKAVRPDQGGAPKPWED